MAGGARRGGITAAGRTEKRAGHIVCLRERGGTGNLGTMRDAGAVIRSLLARNASLEGIGDGDNLLETGLLDSVGVLSLVAGLEEAFRLKIDTKHLTEGNFRSIQAIAALVDRLRAEGSG